MNASGCGAMVKDYGHLLRHDAAYAAKAARISALTMDLAEFLPPAADALRTALRETTPQRVVFHPPCTLQHGQKVRGAVEALLAALGAEVLPFGESHLCCGSAGTYSVLQPELALSAARPQARPPADAAARADPVGQRRLHHPPAERHRGPGRALDRVGRPALASATVTRSLCARGLDLCR